MEGTKWIQDSSPCSPSITLYFQQMRRFVTFTQAYWADTCKHFQRKCKQLQEPWCKSLWTSIRYFSFNERLTYTDWSPNTLLLSQFLKFNQTQYLTFLFLQKVTAELLPTPNKFHYIFNMRDLSRITAGLLQSHPNYLPKVTQIVRLWRNEFARIICDRLINEDVSNRGKKGNLCM